MILWLNGTFGAGKTTVSKELVRLLPQSRVSDSEEVGQMLRHALGDVPVGDFQEWRLDHLAAYERARPWLAREAEVLDTTGVAPQRPARLIAVATGYGTPSSNRA